MKNIDSCRVQKLTEKDLERAAEALEIDLKDYPELLEGMNIENEEHSDLSDCHGDPIIAARIALAHIKEHSNYYQKLKEAGL